MLVDQEIITVKITTSDKIVAKPSIKSIGRFSFDDGFYAKLLGNIYHISKRNVE